MVSGAGDLPLFYQTWSPSRQPTCVVIGIHGVCDHSDRFTWLAQRLAEAGCTFYGPDLRGHGRSGGTRGYIRRWSEFDGDLAALVHLVKKQEGDIPCFLMGHSMGGILVLDYAIDHPEEFAGVVGISPGLRPNLAPWKVAVARLLTPVLPGLALDPGLDLTGTSRDRAVVQQHVDDRLRWKKGSIRLGTETLAAIDRVFAHAHELSIPVCLFHGTGDVIASPEGSRALFERLRTADRRFREYEGGYHVPWLDTNQEEFCADLLKWLADHLQQQVPPGA